LKNILQNRFLKFLCAGGCTTGLDAVLYTTFIFGVGLPVPAAKLFSFSSAFIMGFFLNAKWVYKSGLNTAKLLKYCMAGAFCVAVNYTVNLLMVRLLDGTGLALAVGFIAAASASAVTGYTILRLWVFKL